MSLLFSIQAHAQIDYFQKYTVNGLSLNLGGSLGDATRGYKFSSQGAILERRNIYYGDYFTGNWDWHIKLQYRFQEKYAIEAGFIKSGVDFAFVDKAFNATLSDTNYIGSFAFGQIYVAPTISAYYYYSLPAASQYLMNIYVTAGMNFNFNTNSIFSDPPPYYTNTAQQYKASTNQELDFTIHANPFFVQYYLEGGINFCIARCNLYLGAKYSFSSNMMSGDYQHLQNGTLTYSDHVTSPCNYLSGTIRGGYILFQNWGLPKTPRAKKQKYEKGPKLKTKYIEPKY